MKNQIKLWGLLIGIGITLMAFTLNTSENELPSRKIEIIRTVDGSRQLYDTIIPATSTLTPEEYLEILGFADDKMIEILDLTKSEQETMFVLEKQETYTEDEEGNGSKAVKIVSNINIDIDAENIEKLDMDSLINSFVVKDLDGKSHVFKTQVVIAEREDGEEEFDIDEKWISEDEPNYHFIDEGEGRTIEIKVFGSEDKDLTLVIVTGEVIAQKVSEVPNIPEEEEMGKVELISNYSQNSVKVNYEFTDEAATKIQLFNANGAIVMEIEKGRESGSQSETLDLSSLSTGVYLVNVLHGEAKVTRKILIE